MPQITINFSAMLSGSEKPCQQHRQLHNDGKEKRKLDLLAPPTAAGGERAL